MRHDGSRALAVVLSVVLVILPLFFPSAQIRTDKLYGVVAGIFALFAGVFHLRHSTDVPHYGTKSANWVVWWRKLIASDKLMTIYLLSAAFAVTDISILIAP